VNAEKPYLGREDFGPARELKVGLGYNALVHCPIGYYIQQKLRLMSIER